jgi:hypothetical protein
LNASNKQTREILRRLDGLDLAKKVVSKGVAKGTRKHPPPPPPPEDDEDEDDELGDADDDEEDDVEKELKLFTRKSKPKSQQDLLQLDS